MSPVQLYLLLYMFENCHQNTEEVRKRGEEDRKGEMIFIFLLKQQRVLLWTLGSGIPTLNMLSLMSIFRFLGGMKSAIKIKIITL